MKFIYGKQDFQSRSQAESVCWLLTNGLGGYASTSAAYSVTRCDHGVLIGAVTAPNERFSFVHRLSETLNVSGKDVFLSTQVFADGSCEDGYRHLSSFVWEYGPKWTYHIEGVEVIRRCAMEREGNTTAILYDVCNRSELPCTLTITPYAQFCPKGEALREKVNIQWDSERITGEGVSLYVKCSGALTAFPVQYQALYYADDARDGRAESGLCAACVSGSLTIPAGEKARLELIFSDKKIRTSAYALWMEQKRRKRQLEQAADFPDKIARQLVMSADDYLVRRDSTGGKTIIAGYPFFGDWGRDTMIALPGCTLSTKRYADAKSILQTFLAYEKDGLVPNLFPEGESQPRYNTVDAALLLINCVWLYYQAAGDKELLLEALPVLRRIVSAYQKGTRHGIRMDTDGLIMAGKGLDQVTWMDVCIDGVLPTPRHGKPVEINAYWYNALRILQSVEDLLHTGMTQYGLLAQRVKESFNEQFWMEDKSCLKDVISGTPADTQIRCNQIWAVTMPFTMLSHEREKRLVDTVYRELYTPCGLRTLSPSDPEFHPVYGGPQKCRDMAYHQGTVWPFPLGAYYLAYLKVNDYTSAALESVREQLEALEPMLREGCVGQLPEIYDGAEPKASQGCFAQAWSVGELLRVFEVLNHPPSLQK